MSAVTWSAWLACVTAYAFLVSNPLCLLLALGAVGVVHAARPAGRAVRTFFVAGVVLLAVRLALVALVANPGRTTILTVPRVVLPGGFALGGRVTAEVVVEGFVEGLRLLLVLVAFGVFNASVDMGALVRAVPPAFRDAGLVVAIALAFVPGLLQTVAEVRDAQRLRGEGGVRMLAPSLVVPILGMSLERAFLLAESMDARGYGRLRGPGRRGLVLASLGALVGGLAVWASGRTGSGALVAGAGAVGLAASLRSAGAGVTRMERPRLRARDGLVVAAASGALVLGALAGPAAAYTAYPVLREPGFPLAAGIGAMLLAAPALGARGVRGGSRRSTE